MSATEKHYTVMEVAKLWQWGRDRVVRAFVDEPGVLRFGHEGLKPQGRRPRQRRYWTLSIPESVLIRVHMRFRVNGNEASSEGVVKPKPRAYVPENEPQRVDIEKLMARIGHAKWNSMTELERQQAAMRERMRRK